MSGKESSTVTIAKREYDDLVKAKKNLEYLEMLSESRQQMREGRVITKTWEELEAMANG